MATAADIATESGTTSLGRWLSVLRRRLERSGLLSSALFCLWLSTACVIVWFDFGQDAAPAAAERQAEVP